MRKNGGKFYNTVKHVKKKMLENFFFKLRRKIIAVFKNKINIYLV